MTALTVYFTETAATTVTTADTLLANASTGGTLSNKNTNLTSGTTGWVEIWSQGDASAQTGAGSQPAPSGHGWLLDSTLLEGNHFPAGTWSFSLPLETTTTGTFTADVHFQAYQRSSSAVYTLIGDAVASAQGVISTSYTVVTASVSAAASNTFATGDKLYIHIPPNITTNGTTGNLRMQASSSSSVGSTSAQCVTPGYIAVTTSTRTIPSTAALMSTLTRTITTTAALLQTSTRTIPTTVALQATNTRTIPTSASLGNARTIPTSAALMSTLARVVPTSASLTNTGTRTIPTSAALYQNAVFYASNIAQTLGGLTQSDQMSEVSGGTETSVSVTAPASGANSYVELTAQGGTPTATSALPAPTGKGWSIPLQGNTILAGSWYSIFTLAKSGTPMSGASLYVRWYRRTIDGIYYPIGSTVLSSQTFSTRAIYTTSSVSAALWQFVNGDTLYMDAFAFNGVTSWASDVFTVYVSNSATQGVVNDGTIIAPSIITTPTGLSCLVGTPAFQTGVGIPVLNQSFTLADAVDQRSILTLTGEDAAGTIAYIPNQPVMLSDHDQGKLYDGYLANDKASKPAAGGAAQLEHMLTFADHHRDFDKEANETNYSNWSAGDIVCDFVQQQLYKNGITGAFALESDYTPTTFAQGTLSGTVATTTTSPFVYAPNTAQPPVTTNTGDLELTRAGTQFTLTESVTSDFSSGTLTNMTASGNELTPTTQSALKVVAVAPTGYTANLPPANGQAELVLSLCEFGIWNSSHVLGTNDTLLYDVWVASSSPAYNLSVDVYCSDGSNIAFNYPTYDVNFPSNFVADQNGVSTNIYTDLTNYAKDRWYSRTISLSSLNGKTITQINLVVAGAATGTYTVFLKNVRLGSGYTFFSTSATQTQTWPPTLGANGNYLLETMQSSVVQVYDPNTSYRITPAHSISSVGLVQNSSITWTASLPASGAAPATYPPGAISPASTSASAAGTPAALIYVSYDANTWLLCSNQGALPGLPPGTNVGSLSFYLKEAFQAGSDPSAIPALLQTYTTINSAANNPSATSIITEYGTATEWNTGILSGAGPDANGNLTLNSVAPVHTWPPVLNEPTGTSLFASTTNPTFTVDGSDYRTITATGTNNVAEIAEPWIQFEFAGQLQDFTVDFDWKISTYLNYSGFLYRTTGWTTLWTYNYGYCLKITGSQIILTRGSNSSSATSSGTVTVIATVTSTANHHYTLVVKGDRHTVYLDHSSTAIIDVFDSGIQAGGGFGMLYSPTTANSNSGSAGLANFALLNNTVGYWTSPSISLSSLTTCGYTQIAWSEINQSGQQQATAFVRSSLDSGSTWQICTNNAEIPGLMPGTSVSTLLLQIVLSGTGTGIPKITGLQATVCGSYGTVTGTRVSPVLSLTPVGYVASSNCMWNANTPTNTSLTVATTQDLSTYHTVGSSGAGEALPYWTPQPAATQDLFSTNTLSNYTNTNKSGGSAATVTYNTALSNITLAGGSGGLFLNNAISCTDVDLLVDMDESDAGGLVFRKVDASNYYELGVYDASSSGGFTNQLRLYKIASGTRALLGSASSIVFTRNTFHRVRVTVQGGLINVYWDGQCKQSYLDTSSLGAGACGLRNDGGTSRYYQLWIQPLGTNLTGQALYTKVTMTTSDPSVMPQLFVLVCCVRGPSIATGATIQPLHPVALPFASYYSTEMDTLVQASNDLTLGAFYWYVDRWRQAHFGPRLARPGAFPVQSVDDIAKASGSLLYQPQVTVQVSADLLRNQQIVTNVSGLVSPPPEIKVADGSTTSWTMGYPLYSAPTILINGQPATVGLQGVDNNKQFYWQVNSASIPYDSTLPKLPSGTILSFTYVGQSTVNANLNNSAAQIAQAIIEGGNSGIIAEIESAQNASTSGMTTAQATVFGNGLLTRYSNTSPIEMIGTTLYSGLVPGTVIPLFLPEMMNTWNAQLPIVKLTTTAYQGANGIIYLYSIDATNGANQSNWARVWH